MITELLNSIKESNSLTENTTTDSYNIFRVLQLESDEVRLHSRFLADLLNPQGAHGLRTFFLNSFLDFVKESSIFPDLNRVTVYPEKHVGAVTATTGGQIDILLIDNQNNALIIENKIYAGDQENQLLRYRNFGKQLEQKGGKFHVVYLTLHGTCASDFSIGNELEMKHEHYECLSYKHHISSWLEDCATQLNENVRISTILTHYLQLIKNLTGMENNEQQNSTIAEIIQSKEHFLSAEKITNALLPAKLNLLKHGIEEIAAHLRASHPELYFLISPRFGQKYHGLEIHHTEPKENRQTSHIRFSFLSDAAECYLEIHPGLIDGSEIPKNHNKRRQYIDSLNPYFPKTSGKIMNVENYWQGEWVIHYYTFNGCFEHLLDIKSRPVLINQVVKDLSLIIDEFFKKQKPILMSQIIDLSNSRFQLDLEKEIIDALNNQTKLQVSLPIP